MCSEEQVLNFESDYVNHMKCQHQYRATIHFFISISSAIDFFPFFLSRSFARLFHKWKK